MENLDIDEPIVSDEEWYDPLAVQVGLQAGADDIPADGWPDTLKFEVTERINSYLPEEE